MLKLMSPASPCGWILEVTEIIAAPFAASLQSVSQFDPAAAHAVAVIDVLFWQYGTIRTTSFFPKLGAGTSPTPLQLPENPFPEREIAGAEPATQTRALALTVIEESMHSIPLADVVKLIANVLGVAPDTMVFIFILKLDTRSSIVYPMASTKIAVSEDVANAKLT
jgi:hypothetical protein